MQKKPRINFMFLSLLFCLLWITGFVLAVDRLGKDTAEEQQRALEAAIERNITSCYALEGMFPPTLEYMKQHYGLTYDEKLFFVDYRPIAANIRPDYFIIERTPENEAFDFSRQP